MWADNETDEDLLGFEVHANLIQSIVTDAENLPVTVGLFGDWGSGKSSVLKVLRNTVEAQELPTKHLVIHFDSWIFEGYEDAKTAILSSILNELATNATLASRIQDEAVSLLGRVKWMKVAKIGLRAAASLALSNPLPLLVGNGADQKEGSEEGQIGTLGGLLNPKEEVTYDIRSFRQEFSALLEKTELDSIIVLVDDLDRCSPERIIENLEAIKLFLNVPGMAFVIAADRRIVEDAIRVRYANFLSSGAIGPGERQAIVVDYLEKLIQVPYTLPKLSPNEVRHYLSLLLIKKIIPDQFDHVAQNYREFLGSNRHERYDARSNLRLPDGDDRRPVLDRHLNIIEGSSDPITEGLKGNPRQVKRFLNALWLRQRLAEVSKIEGLDQSVLVKLMVLEYVNVELFSLLYKLHKQSEDGTAGIFVELEADVEGSTAKDENKKWSDPGVIRWLKAEPKLSHVDLRDYFWISRSSLEDSLVGLKILSLAARRCLEQLMSGARPAREAGGQLFQALDESEKQQIISSLQAKAQANPSEPHAVEALFSLATKHNSVRAAEGMKSFYEFVDMDKASIKLTGALASVSSMPKSDATKALRDTVEVACNRSGRFVTALKRAISPKKPK